jgi:hypothetical protein
MPRKQEIQDAFDYLTKLLMVSPDARDGSVFSSSSVAALTNKALVAAGKHELDTNSRTWRTIQNENFARSRIKLHSHSFVLRFTES